MSYAIWPWKVLLDQIVVMGIIICNLFHFIDHAQQMGTSQHLNNIVHPGKLCVSQDQPLSDLHKEIEVGNGDISLNEFGLKELVVGFHCMDTPPTQNCGNFPIYGIFVPSYLVLEVRVWIVAMAY